MKKNCNGSAKNNSVLKKIIKINQKKLKIKKN